MSRLYTEGIHLNIKHVEVSLCLYELRILRIMILKILYKIQKRMLKIIFIVFHFFFGLEGMKGGQGIITFRLLSPFFGSQESEGLARNHHILLRETT